jgi:2-dehydro-3-deoxyglucarate aldolase/4-hydroxy-2-oxoheptanedioate aldolase
MNEVKRKLRAGQVAVGTMMLEFSTTGISRIAAEAGAEFAVFDMEHTGWSIETIRMLMATARAAALVPMVRVPTLEYHFIARALDVGAMGIIVPFVASQEQAQLIVNHAKYPPEGRRGVAFGVAHDDYRCRSPVAEMRSANDEVMLIAQIENIAGLEHAERITRVDGIDALWIGQFDLTTSLGIPGEFDHPLFQEASRRVVNACRQHGKTAVLGSTDPDALARGPAEGFRMLVYLADLWIYQQALSRGFERVRQVIVPQGRHSSSAGVSANPVLGKLHEQ